MNAIKKLKKIYIFAKKKSLTKTIIMNSNIKELDSRYLN